MRRFAPLVVIALAVALAACEPEADSAVKADYPLEPGVTVPAPTTTTVLPTTTTTAKPKPRPTTTTTTTTPAPAAATSSCHASYRGTCIPPDVSDADCYPGKGDGPWYVHENDVDVVGPDVFDLDRDGDNLGCDS